MRGVLSRVLTPPALLPIQRRPLPWLQCRSASSHYLNQQDRPFFNRSKEIDSILNVIQEPGMSVFTGPPNSGKTRLLNEVLARKEEEGCPVLHIDLRAQSFNDVPSFLSSMESSMGPWYKSMAEAAKTLKLDIGPVEFNISEAYKNKPPNVEDLFTYVTRHTPTLSIRTGKQFPIVCIDEANEMKKLVRSPKGIDALESLLKFFVKCTKQDGRFPVLLASSDSFFPLWLGQLVGNGRFNTYVIGHLSRSEAQQYWLEHGIAFFNYVCGQNTMEPPKFEDVYAVCGGSIYYINWYCFDYVDHVRFRGTPLPPNSFSFVGQALMHLHKGIVKLGAKWNREEILRIMNDVIENGYMDYHDLDNRSSKGLVDAMIEENMVHLRPSDRFSHDLDFKHENAIITADSPPSSVAMKKILHYF